MIAQAHAQTGRIFKFTLKKEWLKLILWLLGAAFFVLVGVLAFVEVYGDPADREMMAIAMQNPAMEALFGRALGVDNYTIGAMYTHTMTLLGFVLFAVMSILLVVRNTRAEEEDGILELLQALPTGRLAHTASAILLLVLINVLVALLSAGLLIAFGDSSMAVEGALLTGVMYGSAGLFFGSVTLVTAQLSSNARGAMMLAFGVLGISYILRIIGDSGIELFSWLSPLGLLYYAEPFVSNNWTPVVISLALSAGLILLALFLKHRRDMGAGILPDKEGRQDASSFLKTPLGLAFNLVKTPFFVWTAAMILLGISYGSVIGDVEGLLEGNEIVEQVIAGDPNVSLVDQFMAMILGVLAIISAIPAVQILLKIRGEEKKNRLDKVIAGSHSRYRILGSYVLISVCAAVFLQLVVSLTFGGAAVVMDFDVSLPDIMLAGIGYIPATFVIIGVALVLLGWLPRLTSLVWVYLMLVFINLYLGELFDIPEWLSRLSPFHHVPEMPIEEWSWTVFLTLTFVALIFSIIGFIGYRRRDID